MGLSILKDIGWLVGICAGINSAGLWVVSGRTQKTAVSKEILDQWVEWMVAAGFDHQCEFDGWGTSV